MKRKWILALLVVVLGAGLYGGHVLATPGSGITTTIYAKSLFDPVKLNGFALLPDSQQTGKSHSPKHWSVRLKTHGLTDAYVVDNKIAPGGTTGWHSHPGPSMIFVVAGTVTNYEGDDPTCTGHAYSAGSGFTDAGGSDVHMLRNEGSVPAETIAVQFLPTGADRRIDKPDPGNCTS
jgi:quercetin dioxygenase-like cupin family protein